MPQKADLPTAGASISPARSLAIAAIVAAILILLGCDGALHWDEPGYLYAGIYQDLDEILRGEVQPSGLPWFTLGKPLHILIIHGVYQITGDPAVTALAIGGLYSVLMIASLGVCWVIVGVLMPARPRHVLAGTVIAALSPVVPDLLFKTLSEIPAFFFACLGCLAILNAARGQAVWWLLLGTVSLAVASLTKLPMLIVPISLVLTMICVPVGSFTRRSIFLSGLANGALGAALAIGVIYGLGIGLDRFLGNDSLLSKSVPLVAKLMHVTIAFGFVWLVLPVSLASPRRRELVFFWIWFLLATAPFVILFQHVEPRYLVGSVLPLAGLSALAAEVLWRRLPTRIAPAIAVPVGALVLTVVLGFHKLALVVMPHEVNVFDLRRLVEKFEQRSDGATFAVVTSSLYTDFHMLRVLWPELEVYDADGEMQVVSRSDKAPNELAAAYMDGRGVGSPQALEDMPQLIYYFGFERTFAIENLALILGAVRPGLGDKLRNSFELKSHLRSTWLWDREQADLRQIGKEGHYLAYRLGQSD